MMKQLTTLITCTAISGVAASCDSQPTSPATFALMSEQMRLGSDVEVLEDCTGSPPIAATHTLRINNLNIRRLDEKWRMKAGKNAEKDSSEPATPPPPPRKKTRWDLDLDLKPNEYAILRVELKDSGGKLEFMPPQYAITAGDIVAKETFCRLRSDKHTAEIRAKYYGTTDADSYPSINFGINVIDKDNDLYSIPLHVDPNVKNHG